MARQASPWELISPLNETQHYPTSNLPRKLLLSTVLSLMLGGIAAVLRDRLDPSLSQHRRTGQSDSVAQPSGVPNASALQSSPC
jgi:hypothetical protein